MTNFEVIVENCPEFVKEVLAHNISTTNLKDAVKGIKQHYAWYDNSNTHDKPEMDFLNEEYVQLTLDDIEKKYLSNFIKPFRNRIKNVRKVATSHNGRYFIEINMKEACDRICLPYFYKNTRMYTGMKANKSYTLKELDL